MNDRQGIRDGQIVVDAALWARLLTHERGRCVALPGQRLVLVDHVRHELAPAYRTRLDEAVGDGSVRLEAITDVGDLRRVARLAERLGCGEAACLVLAMVRGWSVGSDDQGRFALEIARWLGSGRQVGWTEMRALAEAGVEDRRVAIRRHG